MAKAIVIGNGSIGSELQRQLKDLGWDVAVVKRGDEWKRLSADIVFLAVPTNGGEEALEYILHFTAKNIPVVTCEKGALSQHFDKLLPHLDRIGVSATVGGGTRMIPYLRSRVSERVDSITGVLNGTLNFIFSKLSEGVSQDEVLKEVLDKKYAEPGASTFEEIIKGELGDLHKKAVILANLSELTTKSIKPDQNFEVPTDILDRALSDAGQYRFLFSMSREMKSDFIAGVNYESDGWYIQVGLCDISGLSLQLPEGVLNGLYIREGESVYSVIGPGAGPTPTALAMIADAKELI